MLLDLTGNDLQKEEKVYLSTTEALIRYFLQWKHPPTVALVDQACDPERRVKNKELHAEHLHSVRRKLAAAYGVPVVDGVFGEGAGAAETVAEKQHAAIVRKSVNLPSSLQCLLDHPSRGTNGHGHNNAAYHEWVAASVFYALLSPHRDDDYSAMPPPEAALAPRLNPQLLERPVHFQCTSTSDEGLGAVLCNLLQGVASLTNFMDPKCPPLERYEHVRKPGFHGPTFCVKGLENIEVDEKGWIWTDDSPGKFGFITCDGMETAHAPALAVPMKCKAGDLIVGYLRSFDAAMGKVVVTAEPKNHSGAPPRILLIDSRLPHANESVFATQILSGLDATSEWRVTVIPIYRKAGVDLEERRLLTLGGDVKGGFPPETAASPPALLHRHMRQAALEKKGRREEARQRASSCTSGKFKLLLLACT